MNILKLIARNRTANNAAWLIGAHCLQSLLSFFINMLTVRYLGPSNYGVVNYAASLTSFLTPVMNLGITSILVQELVQHRDSEGEILGTSFVLTLCSSVLCMISMVAFSMVANPGDRLTVIACAIYSLILPLYALREIVCWYQSHLLSKISSIVGIVAYVVVSAYKIFLLTTGKSVLWFAVSNSLDVLIISAALHVIYRRRGGQRFSFSAKTAHRLFSRGKYYIIPNLMVAIFAQTDRIMLKSMMSSEAVGYYSAAVACAMITNFIFSALIDSFRPVIFSDKKAGRSKYLDDLRLLYGLVIFLSLGQSLFMTVFAKWIVRIIYGAAYAPTVSALQIVVWFTTFSYLGAVRNIWILAEEKQKHLLVINLSGAAANVVLNALLIPRYGILGASAASLATQFFTNIVVGWLIPALRPNNQLMLSALNPVRLLKTMTGYRDEKD